MRVEGSFDIALPRAAVYGHLTDPGLMAACIPGCEAIERVSATDYRARVTIGMAGIHASFNLVVEVKSETPPERVLSQTRGEEGTRASMLAADNEVVLVEVDPGTTRVNYASEVSITGRLGKFALGVMKKKVESLGREFAERLRGRIETQPEAAVQPAAAATALAPDAGDDAGDSARPPAAPVPIGREAAPAATTGASQQVSK